MRCCVGENPPPKLSLPTCRVIDSRLVSASQVHVCLFPIPRRHMQAWRRSVADHHHMQLLKSRGLYGTICEGKVTVRHAASPNKHHLFFWPRVSLRLVVLISRLLSCRCWHIPAAIRVTFVSRAAVSWINPMTPPFSAHPSRTGRVRVQDGDGTPDEADARIMLGRVLTLKS